MEKVKITLKSTSTEMSSANNLINPFRCLFQAYTPSTSPQMGCTYSISYFYQNHPGEYYYQGLPRWCQRQRTCLPMQVNLRDSGRDLGLIPGSGRSPGGGPGNPLWYSCLSYDRGGWGVRRVTQSRTRLMIPVNIVLWLCMYMSNNKVAQYFHLFIYLQ